MTGHKLFLILSFCFAIIMLNSCGTFEKATTLDPKTNYFPAKSNVTVTVIKKKAVNADSLKTLLIVPSTDYWLTMAKNMNYFKEVIIFPDFQSQIIAHNLQDKIPSVSDRIGLNNAYRNYKPFAVLSLTKVQKENGWYAGLTLYDPNTAEVVFQNETKLNLMWDGWTDQGTMFPLFNSLLDYLREQK